MTDELDAKERQAMFDLASIRFQKKGLNEETAKHLANIVVEVSVNTARDIQLITTVIREQQKMITEDLAKRLTEHQTLTQEETALVERTGKILTIMDATMLETLSGHALGFAFGEKQLATYALFQTARRIQPESFQIIDEEKLEEMKRETQQRTLGQGAIYA